MTQSNLQSQFKEIVMTKSDKKLSIYNKPHIQFVKWEDPYIKNKEEKEEEEELVWQEPFPQKAFLSPFGSMSLDVPITNQFKLYIMHTNFNISERVAKIVESIPGVETLDIFSRYRCRVGIGRLFLPREVFRNIRNAVKKVLRENKFKLEN